MIYDILGLDVRDGRVSFVFAAGLLDALARCASTTVSSRYRVHPRSTRLASRRRLSSSLNELLGLLLLDSLDSRHLLLVKVDAVELVGVNEHLATESRGDKLRVPRQLIDHLCNRPAVLFVKIGVNLVKQVERCRVALLNRENYRSAPVKDCYAPVASATSDFWPPDSCWIR